MPKDMTFDEAASVCDGAIIALSGLRAADLKAGQRLLIYGASGAIGTAATQLAKHLGVHVTAVGGAQNVELARSLGADEVINYFDVDCTENGQKYDVTSTLSASTPSGGAGDHWPLAERSSRPTS